MTDQLERGIVKIYPKTYTFTNMPEKIMFNNSDSFSVAIVQPSIIGFQIEELYTGWVDNLHEVIGIFINKYQWLF